MQEWKRVGSLVVMRWVRPGFWMVEAGVVVVRNLHCWCSWLLLLFHWQSCHKQAWTPSFIHADKERKEGRIRRVRKGRSKGKTRFTMCYRRLLRKQQLAPYYNEKKQKAKTTFILSGLCILGFKTEMAGFPDDPKLCRYGVPPRGSWCWSDVTVWSRF